MRSIYDYALAVILACTVLPACASDECDPAPLSEECKHSDRGCPDSKEAAIDQVCEARAGWEEGPNGCGGWTVRTAGSATASAVYDFDASGKLVGVTRWDDDPNQCDVVYGKPCEKQNASLTTTTMDCPDSPDERSSN
jgi:hypothetical protein